MTRRIETQAEQWPQRVAASSAIQIKEVVPGEVWKAYDKAGPVDPYTDPHVGEIRVEQVYGQPYLTWVGVRDTHTRRGLATALWQAAGRPKYVPRATTESGRAWAEATGVPVLDESGHRRTAARPQRPYTPHGGMGDDDPSGFVGMTNRDIEKIIAENEANGYEAVTDPARGIKFRRKRMKPAELAAPRPQADLDEVARHLGEFRANHPGVEIGDLPPSADPRMVGDLLAGLHDMSAKYPQASVRALRTTSTDPFSGRVTQHRDPRWYARTSPVNPWRKEPQASELAVSPGWLSDYDDAVKQHEEGVGNHWFAPYSSRSPAYTTAVHEFGHALDHAGGGAARAALQTELRKHFLELHPELRGQPRLDLDGAYSDWLHEQVPGYGLRPVEVYAGLPWHEGKPWVGKKPKVKLNEPEALAEAFADVEINGDNATDASKFLHQRLVDHAAKAAAADAWRRGKG